MASSDRILRSIDPKPPPQRRIDLRQVVGTDLVDLLRDRVVRNAYHRLRGLPQAGAGIGMRFDYSDVSSSNASRPRAASQMRITSTRSGMSR